MMSLSIEDFGRLLAAKRGGRGVRAAALEAGVTHSTFSRVENGHMPDLKTFAKLCKWLARDPREFFGIVLPQPNPTTPRAAHPFKQNKTDHLVTAKELAE